ncbi:hypothetical protein FOMPIDRAFT_90008, partial [Fomitopsis schrenkii]
AVVRMQCWAMEATEADGRWAERYQRAYSPRNREEETAKRHESPSMSPATPEPYTGCRHCTSDAVVAVDPDGIIDWNYRYWGYRSKRRTIVRPLPRSITDRIPLELFEHILDFLPWHKEDLYNCALLGPSLDSLKYERLWTYDWNPSAIASCTRLSTLELQVTANPIDSWQGLVTGFHEMLSHCSSPVMRTLKIDIYMNEDLKRGPPAPVHPDREFWTLNLGSIHDLMKQPLFNSLQDVRIRHWQDHVWYARLTCDAVLTAEEKERRLRLILEPWDKRGILTVKGYNELTDEELRRRRPGRHASNLNAKVGDPSAGAGGEEAQSPNDEIVLASGQEDKHGREGAV